MHRSLARARTAALLSLSVVSCALAFVGCSDDDDGDTTSGPGPSSSASSSGAGAEGGGGSGAQGGSGGTGGTGGSGGGAGGTGGAESQMFHIPFEARVGAAAFACGETYADVGTPPTEVAPVDLKMYISGVKLVKADGSGSVPLELEQDGTWQFEDVVMLDFEDASGECEGGTAQTNTMIMGSAPPGDYLGLELTVGVPANKNFIAVETAPSPLNYMGMYWDWAIGRIYWSTMFESTAPDAPVASAIHFGAMDCEGDATADPPEPVVCENVNSPVLALAGFDPASSKVIVDVGALLQDTNLEAGSQCHSFPGNPACEGAYQHAGVNYADGKPIAGQTVFSVE